MLRALFAATILALGTSAASILLNPAAAVALTSDQAPADEYFGPFKYSAISVRTKINALGRAYNERWEDDSSIVHDALMLESSLRVWAQRYPKDSWLAPTAYHLAQLYQEVQTDDARNHARAMYQFLAANFPSSKEAHFARLRLQQGFPALHAEPAVSPTPSPYGPPASPSPIPGASPSAAPSGATPAPSTAMPPPAVTPTPSTAPPATATAPPAATPPATRSASPAPSAKP
jgi:hypothetical protein